MREWLLDGFRYDLWANRLWMPVATPDMRKVTVARPSEMPQEPRARAAEVFVHILWAQRVWLERLGAPVEAEGEGWLPALYEAWEQVLSSRAMDEIVAYRNLRGMPFEQAVGDIATHVLNHGTYHRGQLREIADNFGLEYPETDYMIWRTTSRG